MDVLLPDQEDFDVIIWFHGGGVEAGNRKEIGGFAEELIQKGSAIVSPEYRLYPKAQFPDFVEDAAHEGLTNTIDPGLKPAVKTQHTKSREPVIYEGLRHLMI